MDAGRYKKAKSGIHIKPSREGSFTRIAKSHNQGVQEFASKVLANKEDYPASTVKKANFAHSAAQWNKK